MTSSFPGFADFSVVIFHVLRSIHHIAHTLGFQPVVDPHFEVFPGEMIMMPFQVGVSDQSIMITAQLTRTRPTLHWLAPDRFVVHFTPTDHLGNIAWPAEGSLPRLMFRRQQITTEYRNHFDSLSGWTNDEYFSVCSVRV